MGGIHQELYPPLWLQLVPRTCVFTLEELCSPEFAAPEGVQRLARFHPV
jgi:hypothetical protein